MWRDIWQRKMWRDLLQHKRKKQASPPQQNVAAPITIPEMREAPEALLRRMQWTILRPLATYLGGSERSLMRGPGMEMAEMRAYQPGDDIRFIDWNTTARTEEPMIREAHVDRALDVWFLLDLSASINWGTTSRRKLDLAMDFTTVAGQVLGRSGNRVGALLFAEKPLLVIPPATGRMHLMHVLSKIHAHTYRVGTGPTNLAAILSQAQSVIRRRSLVVVVSDFLVSDGWQKTLSALARRHEVVAVRLYDPREGELPDVGLITLEDPETGQQLFVDTGDKKLRARFVQAAHEQAERINVDLSRCGVASLLLNTHEELLPAFIRFLHARRLHRTRGTNRLIQASFTNQTTHSISKRTEDAERRIR